MQMKKKAAFVDHSFHKKTQSTNFIKELLSETFDITYYYDESWIGGDNVSVDLLNNGNYEYVFYLQVIHGVNELKRLKKKIVWFPMLDNIVPMKDKKLFSYLAIRIKVVCFSKTLYDKLKKLGFDCVYFQYFMNPEYFPAVIDYDTKRVYFWNRTEEINWDVVKKILGNNHIDALTFMAVPDPYHTKVMPTEEAIKKYNIKIYEKFLEQDDYHNLVSQANIYIAPREYEGIGMCFLEALCRAQCVIASNSASMNEYIKHGENGYLYDLNNIGELDLSNIEEVAKEARKMMYDGFKIWQQQKVKLLEYVEDDNCFCRNRRLIIFLKVKYFRLLELVQASTSWLIRRILNL